MMTPADIADARRRIAEIRAKQLPPLTPAHLSARVAVCEPCEFNGLLCGSMAGKAGCQSPGKRPPLAVMQSRASCRCPEGKWPLP